MCRPGACRRTWKPRSRPVYSAASLRRKPGGGASPPSRSWRRSSSRDSKGDAATRRLGDTASWVSTAGRSARLAGVTPEAIRYYEREGLLSRPARTPAGYRQYGERELAELLLIKRARRVPPTRSASSPAAWADRPASLPRQRPGAARTACSGSHPSSAAPHPCQYRGP
ncbi:MAG: MerR family DNA-binding transcriptional regulator [Gemmatimonadetes bacterium]|nr:MerR family DNA-binding transcriptional regulator [Gemmatimonadota bacterium]